MSVGQTLSRLLENLAAFGPDGLDQAEAVLEVLHVLGCHFHGGFRGIKHKLFRVFVNNNTV